MSNQIELAKAGQIAVTVKPYCWDFAMDFLGAPESDVVNEYVAGLEAEVHRLRAALAEAEAGLVFAGADVEPASDFVPSPTAALRIVRAALLPSNALSSAAAVGGRLE